MLTARGPVTLSWGDRDAHRWAAPPAVAGVAAGVGTAVIGLPPVDLHGPPHVLGVMDPLCGDPRHALWVLVIAAWETNQQAGAVLLRTTQIPFAVPPLAAGALAAFWLVARARPARAGAAWAGGRARTGHR